MSEALNVKSGLDIIVEEMNKNEFMDVVIKRKMPDGSFVDASPASMSVLSTQAKVATQAQALLGATKEERTKWAIEMKNYANALYAEHRYADAMEKYVEALTAADFGTKTNDNKNNDNKNNDEGLSSNIDDSLIEPLSPGDKSEIDNIDVLVVPVLTNLAACSIQLEQWKKAYKFCQQAIELRPDCAKAYMRKGIALFNLGDYNEAKQALLAARTVSASNSKEDRVLAISEHDDQRITILLNKIQTKLNAEKAVVAKQKAKLKDLFDKNAKKSMKIEPIVSQGSHPDPGTAARPTRHAATIYELITALIMRIIKFLASILGLAKQKEA